MASNYDPSLNLAAILQSLSSHTQQTSQPSLQSAPSLDPWVYNNQAAYQHDPQAAQHSLQYHQNGSIGVIPGAANDAVLTGSTPIDNRHEVQTRQNQQQARIPPRTDSPVVQTDPRSLIEWSKGLRYVNKLAGRNSSFGLQIQKMIANQLKHEKEWWTGRQALIEQQSARAEGSKKIQDVLKAIGGDASSASGVPVSHLDESSYPDQSAKFKKTQTQIEEELYNYDKKVYKASQDMAKAIKAELKALSVPFFDVHSDLILASSEPLKESEKKSFSSSSKITEQQLLDLQQRILQYLEDMYKP